MSRLKSLISMIGGVFSSLFTMGCDFPGAKIYGPPEMLDEYQRTGKIKHFEHLDEMDKESTDEAERENEHHPKAPEKGSD